MTDPRHHTYIGNDRKEVQVEVDGQDNGALRSWDQADDRSWSGMVSRRREPGEVADGPVPR